jgi:hypothetical protein
MKLRSVSVTSCALEMVRAHPDNKLSGPPELHLRPEVGVYLCGRGLALAADRRSDGYQKAGINPPSPASHPQRDRASAFPRVG